MREPKSFMACIRTIIKIKRLIEILVKALRLRKRYYLNGDCAATL